MNMYFASIPVSVERAPDGSPSEISIALPSGRLKGTVTDALGKAIEADVQVLREQQLIAAAASNADGEFDIVGLPAEEVSVRASAVEGDSPLQSVTIRDEAESTVALVIAADMRIRGHLQLRSGRPVSGAFIRYSSPSILDVRETTAGVSGDFTLSVPSSLPFVDLVILAAGAPATIGRTHNLRRGEVVDLVLDEQGAAVNILLGGTPSWPFVGRQGVLVSLASLFPPRAGGPPPGLSREGYETSVAPGLYHFCPTAALSSTCKEVLLAPLTHTVVDFSKPAAP